MAVARTAPAMTGASAREAADRWLRNSRSGVVTEDKASSSSDAAVSDRGPRPEATTGAAQRERSETARSDATRHGLARVRLAASA